MTSQSGSDNTPLLIVGIGASAGGLDAFSGILRHLSTDTGMAFVLVQHLAPEQHSMLSELLGRTTQMQVITAEDGMVIEANHVYVIPPDAQMTIAQGLLQLAPREGQERFHTIDLFFQSLAADQRNKAIAVVLSGNNDDGSAGVQAVRSAGGITFAQDRASAEFPAMPSAAIATGQIDFVLSPAKIAEELVNISRQPYLREPVAEDDSEPTPEFEENDLLSVFRLLQKHTGVDFANYKPTTFERRLRRRMALQKLVNLPEYVRHLRDNPTEIQALYQDVLITVTNFFRDGSVYTVLKEQVLPSILQQESATSAIRVWVPGCATGEEAYSIAICLLECIGPLPISPTIQIFGTDIDDRAIEEARLGFYRENRLEGVSSERRRRFFFEVDGGYQVNKSVRETCIFAKQDLSSDPPFSDIDLVSCRNVLIYFKPPLQRRILSIFHYSLKPTGYLVLGNSENVGDTSELFTVFDAQTKVYTRQSVPTRLSFDFITSNYPQEVNFQQPQGFSASLSRSNVQQWADQIVLNRYAPVGVIVNERLEIVQFRGETSPFLRPAPGEPSFNLLKMIRPSLLVDVRTAIEQAKEQGIAVQRQQLQIEDIDADEVSLEVIPFNVSMANERCFLVLFERSSSRVSSSEPEPDAPSEPTNSDPAVRRLQQDLAATRQELLDTQTFLQLTIEEQEATNQQLIAANEEILSSNEELKSTNEELQTAKEEIQSANEELRTTNEELQSRNSEARRANDDLINLIHNFNIPILMLSADLCIRRFTPVARGVFNLIPSDVGRPISDIRLNINVPDLEPLILEVIETLNATEREVQDQEGHWYLLRIRPYRTVDNQIDGAVVALVDIDNLKRTEQELRDSQTQLEMELFAINQVQALSLQLFTSADLNQALSEVLDATIAIHHTEMGYIQLYDLEHNTLEIVAQRGFDENALTYLRNMPLDEASTYYSVLSSGQRIIVEDVQAGPNFELYREIAATAGFQAMQSTPLVNRSGELLGVLSTHFSQPQRPPERELRMLDLYARQASEFITLIRAEREQQALMQREQDAQTTYIQRVDEFLSMLSHELRTPLNSVLGWTEVIERSLADESTLNPAITSIKAGAYAQLTLIEDLLDTSRIVQERFQITPQATDLTALVEQAIASARPQITDKDLQLEVDLEPCLDPLTVDPGRITQAVSNILLNAIKFTPNGGRITIQLTYSPSQVQMQISDTGRGIAPEVLPDIFDRFRQADASITRREGGLGLGLFLVRSIIEAHDGTVQATSAGRGQGATFTIVLPKIAATTGQDEGSSPLVTTEASIEGVRILIVEDTEDNRILYTFALEELGAVVLVASSAHEALDILATQPVDVLVSDIGLPEVDGYELIRRVRALPADQGGQIPAIALTGYVSQEDIQTAMAAGFQRHLAKPISFDDLVDAIFRLVQT